MFLHWLQVQSCPDYVFGDGYSLVPLGDLEIFITREGHLPKVASEKEGGNRKLESPKLSWHQAEPDKKTSILWRTGLFVRRLKYDYSMPVTN